MPVQILLPHAVHAYANVARLGNVCPERYSKHLPYPSMLSCAAALTTHIIAVSRARHVQRVSLAERI